MPNTANGNVMDKNIHKANSFEIKYKYLLMEFKEKLVPSHFTYDYI